MEHMTVSRKTFDKVCDIVKKNNLEEITFELIVGSCFPDAYENMQNRLKEEHTKGYIEALASIKTSE